jgi:hypothetical protein
MVKVYERREFCRERRLESASPDISEPSMHTSVAACNYLRAMKE